MNRGSYGELGPRVGPANPSVTWTPTTTPALMATVQYAWAFEAPEDLGQPSGVAQSIPAQGKSETKVALGRSALAALAEALDTTRAQLNNIVTCWKDLVGPEQDSCHGIGSKNGESADANDEEDEGEEDEEDGEE